MKGVIRGFHIQRPPYEQTKYLWVVHGEIVDISFPLNDSRPNDSDIVYERLHADGHGIVIPSNYAHSYQTISETSLVIYICIGAYSPQHEVSINPLSLGIDWPITPSIISKKDLAGLSFQE
ncbi:hypothetical protein MASR1M60_21500 [Rhodocyclaceae bacterium]